MTASQSKGPWVFIPEPGRWALVRTDGHTVFDVLGWRYNPDTNESQPVVSTRKNKGVGTMRVNWDATVLVPQWEGIVFGTGWPTIVDTSLKDWLERKHSAYLSSIIAEVDAEQAERRRLS
jgi:hypothetical protein